jgi:hypothetical protein
MNCIVNIRIADAGSARLTVNPQNCYRASARFSHFGRKES